MKTQYSHFGVSHFLGSPPPAFFFFFPIYWDPHKMSPASFCKVVSNSQVSSPGVGVFKGF